MSIPLHGLSTLTQNTASITTTIASTADAGAPNSSAFKSSFCVNRNNESQTWGYLIRNLFYFPEKVFTRRRRKGRAEAYEKASELDLFSMPPNLNNEKMHTYKDGDNYNEKQMSNLDAL